MDSNPKNQTKQTSSVNVSSTEVEKAVCGDVFEAVSLTGSNNNNSPNNNGDNTVANAIVETNNRGNVVVSTESCVSKNQISQMRPLDEEYGGFEVGFLVPRSRYIFTSKNEIIVRIYKNNTYEEMTVTDKNKKSLPEGQLEEAKKSYERYLDINKRIKDPIERLSALLDCHP